MLIENEPKDNRLIAGSKPFLNVGELAHLMDVPESTVYELARQQRIGGMVRFGRHIRFARDVLERWLKAGGEGGKA